MITELCDNAELMKLAAIAIAGDIISQKYSIVILRENIADEYLRATHSVAKKAHKTAASATTTTNIETTTMHYPSVEDRQRWDNLPVSRETHASLFPHIDALHSIERGGASAAPPLAKFPLRIMAWNQERGRCPAQAAALIAEQQADVTLLSEMDIGMARTHQRHTVADLAERLDQHYLFGTEFIEFSLGSDIHKTPDHDDDNTIGLHGNAILSRQPLQAPQLIRLERTGNWFTHPHGGEKRIGGRLAIAATLMVEVDGQPTPIVLVTVHLESHSNPDDRAAQIAHLLLAIDDHYGQEQPVIIGGDLNTSSRGFTDCFNPETLAAEQQADPTRFTNPVAYEPLFDTMSAHGYQWQTANVKNASTQRFTADQTTHAPTGRPLMKLDWLLTRGVTVADPQVIPAFAPDGAWLSDHDAVAITITGLSS